MSRSPRGPRHPYVLVVLGGVSYGLLMFAWFSLPAYLPVVIDELGLSGLQAGVLAGAVPLTYVPLALLSGLAIDRIGPGRGIALGVACYGTAQLARAFAPGFPSLLVGTLAIGVGGTAITFGLPKLVSVLFDPTETGTPSAVYLVGASAGTATAFAIGRPVIGPLVGGWRPLFLWSGVVALAFVPVWLVAVYGVVGRGRREAVAGGTGTFTTASVGADLRTVVGNRQLRLLVVVGSMYLLCAHGLQGWLPTLLESRGLDPTWAGRTTSLYVGASVAGVLVVPAIADRLTVRRPAVMGCGGLAVAGIAGIAVGDVGLLAVLGIVVVGVGIGGISPLVRAIPPDLDGIGPALTGTAVGLVFAVGEAGGFLGPVLLGGLRDLTGSFLPGLALLAVGGAIIVVAGRSLDA